MAQPGLIVANRTGFTTYWNYSWFVDLNYKYTYHQDFLISKFVSFFILFGILHNYHPWISQNFTPKKNEMFTPTSTHHFKYYRLVFLRRVFFPMRDQYLRKPYPVLYYSRIWIHRIFNWLVVMWFFYKPKTVLKSLARRSFISGRVRKQSTLKKTIFWRRKEFVINTRFTNYSLF